MHDFWPVRGNARAVQCPAMKTIELPALRALSGVLLAASLLLGACAGGTAPPPTAVTSVAPTAPTEVSVSAAASMRDDGAFMLDVREPDEWAAGHISGATLIPLGQLPGRLAEVPRGRMVITVCRTGHRAAEARDILLGAGFDAVSSMTGGMNDWIAANLPVVTGP